MTDSPQISFRLPADAKAAMERKSTSDDRSVSAYLKRLVIRDLQESGHLPKDGGKG